MEIRFAKMYDAGFLKALNKELYAHMSKHAENEFKEAGFNNEFIQKVIISNMSDFILIVDKEPIGYAFIQAKKTYDMDMIIPHNFATLNDLYIKEEYRGKGYGKELIKASENWAKIRGLEYIELNVLSSNKDAIDFYSSINFKEKQKVLRLEI